MNSTPLRAALAAAPVYLGYAALIRRYQLQVAPLRSDSVGVDRAIQRHITTFTATSASSCHCNAWAARTDW